MSLFALFAPKQTKVKKRNNATKLKPGQQYNVVSSLNREIYHQASYDTFDDALKKTINIMKNYTTNSQMRDFVAEFNPNQKRGQYAFDDFGLAFDRKANTIQAWSNVKGDVDVKVLIF